MKKIRDFENVSEAGSFQDLPAGGYVCVVIGVEDVPEKEYLRVECDIAEGPYKDYAMHMLETCGFNPLKMFKSYKESAKGFFKRFISAVEKSNPGYPWNWDEHSLIGKRFGAVLGEEQYRKNNGDIGTRLYCDRELAASEVAAGNYAVPDKKLLAGVSTAVFVPQDRSTMTDEEIEALL